MLRPDQAAHLLDERVELARLETADGPGIMLGNRGVQPRQGRVQNAVLGRKAGCSRSIRRGRRMGLERGDRPVESALRTSEPRRGAAARRERVPGLDRLDALDSAGRRVVAGGGRRCIVDAAGRAAGRADRRPRKDGQAQHRDDGGADAHERRCFAKRALRPSSVCVRAHLRSYV
jgi:hypothetical protein